LPTLRFNRRCSTAKIYHLCSRSLENQIVSIVSIDERNASASGRPPTEASPWTPLETWPYQGLWRIEYLNTGRAMSAICKQTGGGSRRLLGREDFTYRLFVRWLAKIIQFDYSILYLLFDRIM